jgi:hypothetical protein
MADSSNTITAPKISRTTGFERFKWEDHLTHAYALADMIAVAARGFDDQGAQAGLCSVAESIREHFFFASSRGGRPVTSSFEVLI